MDDVNKKLRIRKEVVFKTFAECNTTYETLKRKTNAVKTIEDEIIDISNDKKLISNILLSKAMNLRSKQNQNWLLWKN